LLIFDTQSKQLVLLDEPKLLLHPAWQDDLLPLFQQICELNEYHPLMAAPFPFIHSRQLEHCLPICQLDREPMPSTLRASQRNLIRILIRILN
jgi:hypothetical protein